MFESNNEFVRHSDSAVIVCPGLTCNPDDMPALLELGDVYTVNRGLSAFDSTLYPRGCFFIDSPTSFPELEEKLQDPKVIKIILAESWKNWKDYPSVATYQIRKKDTDDASSAISRPSYTTPCAYLCLVGMKYKRIYFYGCDLSYKVISHCYFTRAPTNHTGTSRQPSYDYIYNWLMLAVPVISKDLKIETYALTSGRLSDFLTTVSIKQAFVIN